MTVQKIITGTREKEIDVVAPAAQLSTDAYAAITDGNIDARGFSTLSITIAVITNAVTWEVYGANKADFSDEVVAQAGATVAAGAKGSFTLGAIATGFSYFAFYRVKIKATTPGSQGTATITAFQK